MTHRQQENLCNSMYTKYFGLNEKPFAITPNPRYLYMSKLHKEAFAHLLYGIENNGCFILLTGNIGTGKTTICRCLLQQLPENTDVAVILNPMLSVEDLLKTIVEELNVDVDFSTASVKDYIDFLNSFLLENHGKGRNTTLIIDEAQNLEKDVLEQLRLLTNLETDTQKLLRIILIGQPELRETLNDPGLAQLNQRITSRYHLTPLRIDDVPYYIQHRVETAGGGQARLFSERAIRVVERHTDGIPRLINLLCDHALLGAYAENAPLVDHKIMGKAAREILQKKEDSFFFRNRMSLAITVLVACVTVSLFIYYQNPDSYFGKNNSNNSNVVTSTPPAQEPASVENKSQEKTSDSLMFRAKLHKIKYSPPIKKDQNERFGVILTPDNK